MDRKSLIYDWNHHDGGALTGMPVVEVHDETLRDGLQSPSATDPEIRIKLQIVELLDRLGVASACVGLPGANARANEDTDAILENVVRKGLKLEMCAAARTVVADVEPIVALSRKWDRPIQAMMFLGCSPIRMYTESWTTELLEERTREAVRFAVQSGIPAAFVTEDTTRARPETLERLFAAAIEEGAGRLVLCDTVGQAHPDGVVALVRWVKGRLSAWGVADRVKLDWHGHNDRGLAVVNALYAGAAGCDRLHGTILGVGERVGNASLDQLLINLAMIHEPRPGLSALAQLVDLVSDAVGVPIPVGWPAFGKDAFRTATGVHAAAIIKATATGDLELADRVYSAVPARFFGRDQVIEIGHMSGRSNVRFWLERRGIDATPSRIEAVFNAAKCCPSTLATDAIMAIVEANP
jgi:2-isopropylmalate synthase